MLAAGTRGQQATDLSVHVVTYRRLMSALPPLLLQSAPNRSCPSLRLSPMAADGSGWMLATRWQQHTLDLPRLRTEHDTPRESSQSC